jgi:hypothetical protein
LKYATKLIQARCGAFDKNCNIYRKTFSLEKKLIKILCKLKLLFSFF